MDINTLEVGKKYWECSGTGNLEFIVLAAPFRKEDRGWACLVDYGKGEQEIFAADGLEHYGPSIYERPAYTGPRNYLPPADKQGDGQ